MSRTRHILWILLLLFAVEAALAQRRPPIHWVSGTETLVIQQGETVEFEARFYSDIAIPNPAWCFSPSLEPLFTAGMLRIGLFPPIEPNKIYTLRVRLRAPADQRPRPYAGDLVIFRWPRDPAEGIYPEGLPIKIYVMEPSD